RQGTDLELGVLEQQAHDLGARVPARSGDRHASHVHDYTESRTSMHPAWVPSPDLLRSTHRERARGALLRWVSRKKSRQVRGSDSPRARTRVRSSGASPAADRASREGTVSMPARTNRPD